MIAIATFGSCSDSGNGGPANANNAAGERGAAEEPGAAGTTSAVGGGPTENAGADAGPAAAGVAGQDSAGGGSAYAGAGAGANAGAGPGPEASGGAAMDMGEALTFCPRLITPSLSAFDVTRDYDHAVFADCRVKWVTNLYLQAGAREDFLNDLLSWSLDFWGCLPPPVDNFALIYQSAPLTSADAAAIIDDYMLVATADLTLSTSESQAMRAALGRLSQQTIAQDSPDYSQSTCGTGGASGTGGTSGTGGPAGPADKPRTQVPQAAATRTALESLTPWPARSSVAAVRSALPRC